MFLFWFSFIQFFLLLFLLFPTHADHTVKLRTFAALKQELERFVTEENSLVWPYLDHINAHLHNAMLACKAATSSHHLQVASTSFTPKEVVAHGKKMEQQWQFIKTTKPSRCKKAGIVLRYLRYLLFGNISNLNTVHVNVTL